MKLILRLLLCVFLTGCSAESISGDDPRADMLFGKWKMKSYADGQEIPFDVTIEFKNEKDSLGRHILSGKSPLNFYFSTFEVDFSSKAIKLFDIQITKIQGEPNIISFENKYYETLSKVDYYQLSNDGSTMTLLLPESENQYIIYHLIP